jgi:hypothetical protein
MATTSIKASSLFEVNGLVAVITGGGSGMFTALSVDFSESNSDSDLL